MRNRRASRIAIMAAGIALAVAPIVLHRAPARADNTPGANLGGYAVSSHASGLDMLYNDGKEVDATVPDASTSFGTGTGHALAADFYPGPVGANPGSTLKQFLGANLPAQLVGPLSTLTYPAKAEAYSGGPNDSSFPAGGPPQAFSSVAHADAAKAKATGTLVSPGVNASATSETTLGASSVTTTASSTVSDLDIAGVIHIGRVTSTATASSDGTTGKSSGSTKFEGLSVAGMALSLDATGITVGPTHLPLSAAALLNPAIKALGLTITQSPTVQTIKGASAVEHAGAVTIFINPPQNGGNNFTVTLGGAEAEATASPSFTSPPPATGTIPTADTTTPIGPLTPIGPSVGTGTSGPSPAPASDNQSAFAPATTTPPAADGSVALPAVPAAANFAGIKAGLIILGLILAGASAFGMGKIPDDVLADKASASPCPLERSSP